MKFTVEKRFIIFPIKKGEEEVNIHFNCNDFTWNFSLPLSCSEVAEYSVFYDMQYLIGQEAEVDIINESIKESLIIFSDEFNDNTFPLYKEPHRPLYHFTAPRGWINDPNGLVKKDGKYHMFYQSNPFGCAGFYKGWGHAVSDNLFDWKVLPPALSADENGYAISGSALFDTENRSGFGVDSWILAYSSRMHMAPELGQKQNIAYSCDGQLFHKFEGNPIITDFSGLDFRDPKVFWHEESNSFVMVITFGKEMRFYRSDNLINWSLSSIMEDSQINPDGNIYECPELMEYSTDDGKKVWVLSFSWISDRSVYFLFGNFDGFSFKPFDSVPMQKADWGRDFYAAVGWNPQGEMKGRKLWIGWMCYWPYSSSFPTEEGWLNMFTVPRSLDVVEINNKPMMKQSPAKELDLLIEKTEKFANGEIFKLPKAFMLEGCVKDNTDLEFKYSDDEIVRIKIESGKVLVDRSKCNKYEIDNGYIDLLEMPLINKTCSNFKILGDKNSLELYFDDGLTCMSVLCFSKQYNTTLTISNPKAIDDLTCKYLRSADFKI